MAVESKKITRSDLKKVFWRSLTFQMSWCYERMQAQGFCATIIPILKKIYTKKEDLTLALKRHLEFFNTCPNYGGYPILGITVALEEQQADPDMIRGIKTALTSGGLGRYDDVGNFGTVTFLNRSNICNAGIGFSSYHDSDNLYIMEFLCKMETAYFGI